MKLPPQLVASILLTSVCAAGWPYREIVGVEQSASPLFVAPVYGVAPAVSLLDPAKEAVATIVAGPVTGTTIVEGSSSGPVTVVSPGDAITGLDNSPPSTKNATVAPAAPEDSVLIKGASAGPVTLVAPSDNPAAIVDSATSARAETKKEVVASSASSSAGVAIENSEESSNPATISQTIGIASAKAIIGPSTGPVIIVGPTAPPAPTTVAVPTVVPLSDASTSIIEASSETTNISISSNATVQTLNELSASVTDTTEPTGVRISASNSSQTITQNSGNSVVFASARVNLITPAATIAASEVALSNAVLSATTVPTALVSGSSGTVSAAATAAASALLL
ncbi:PREDICTED: flocculation protein FLO11-like [Dufourea novaeangliae]|uniref:flocculation protein FLO11-like n=1 Tax=Dufourea novaeangliae TaxID=178035 RepID=UPI00076792C6|nr:PREDICTED: flocculation protein FLO11-like [Dufourea novaeangliae]